MANTYTQIYIQYVFAVQNRISLIADDWQTDLYKYMTGIIANQEHKLLSINGIPDHVHILVSMNPKQAPSDLMFHVKKSSSIWINDNNLCPGKFTWQEGFGAFSYGKSQIPTIAKYIENQKQHHKKKSFIEEYKRFLTAFGIEFDDRYIYKSID